MIEHSYYRIHQSYFMHSVDAAVAVCGRQMNPILCSLLMLLLLFVEDNESGAISKF